MIKLTSSKYPDYYIEVAEDGLISTALLNNVIKTPLPELIAAGDLKPVLIEEGHPYAIWVLAYLPFAGRFKKDTVLPDSAYWSSVTHQPITSPENIEAEGAEPVFLTREEAMRATRFVVMDVETTGLTENDDIIQLSAVRFEDGEIVAEFDQLIEPRDISRVSQLITDITGIEQSHVLGKPKFHQVIDDFMGFVGEDIWVGHNVTFDLRMIRQELERMGRALPAITAIDTLTVTKQMYPFWPSRGGTFKLENLKHRLEPGLIEDLSSHNALDDSKMCGYWLLHMQKEVS